MSDKKIKILCTIRKTLLLSIAVWFIGSISPVISIGTAGNSKASGIKNVIVIILDALRADHLGIYGYPRNTSPNIDRLGKDGIVFDQAIVQAGWTRPSVASYFTSLNPGTHQTLLTNDALPLQPLTMAEVFSHNGYFCYGFIHNANIESSFGFNRGFNVYSSLNDEEIIESIGLSLRGKYIDPQEKDSEHVHQIARFIKKNPHFNLVENPGFEEGVTGWKGSEKWRQSSEAHSGSYAMHLDMDNITQSNFWHLNQPVKLEYGNYYLFGAYVKVKQLLPEVYIEMAQPGVRNKLYFSTNKISGTSDWQLLLGVFRTRNCDKDNLTDVTIRAGRVQGLKEGEFWIDDIFIVPLEKIPAYRPAEKIFYYLHILNPHNPYNPPPRYAQLFKNGVESSLADKYDGEIRDMDDRLGIIFEMMKSLGLMDNSLIVITADHGEAFGEHGYMRHGSKKFHNEVARVPLILYSPRLFPEPERINIPVESSLDLLPSLVDILGFSLPEKSNFQGHSYFQKDLTRSPYAFFYELPDQTDSSDHNTYVKTVTDGEWKYVTNEYFSFIGNTEIRGVDQGESGTEIMVASPGGKKVTLCHSLEELQKSDFLKSFGTDLRNEIMEVFRDARGKKAMLYNIRRDPGEKKNLISQNQSLADNFREVIRTRINTDRDYLSRKNILSRKKTEISADIRNKLRALGYIN